MNDSARAAWTAAAACRRGGRIATVEPGTGQHGTRQRQFPVDAKRGTHLPVTATLKFTSCPNP